LLRAATNSSVFQGIIRPFSARVAALNAAPGRKAVKGCLPLPANLRVPAVHPQAPVQGRKPSSRELLATVSVHVTAKPSHVSMPATPPPKKTPLQEANPMPPKQTPAPQPLQSPSKAEAAILHAFKSTFTPQLPGLTPANVNARVSCPQHKATAAPIFTIG
jgi:hypothetical protein